MPRIPPTALLPPWDALVTGFMRFRIEQPARCCDLVGVRKVSTRNIKSISLVSIKSMILSWVAVDRPLQLNRLIFIMKAISPLIAWRQPCRWFVVVVLAGWPIVSLPLVLIFQIHPGCSGADFGTGLCIVGDLCD